MQLGRAHVRLRPETHGFWIAKGLGFEADMFMVLLVRKVGGARDVVKYGGWPDRIVSVRCESDDTGVGGREQVWELRRVPWKVLFGAFRL